MIRTHWIRSSLICLTVLGTAIGVAAADDVEIAMGADSAARDAVIVRLREIGPTGLEKLLDRARELERQQAATPNDAAIGAALASLDRAIEQVGGAKYCRQSGLYWYTDLEQAKAAARASGKPILALRMLGNLTDEFSCANSRFFRTTLYANAEISRYLRDNFVLSWKSVRPVPKITIDFGDGRKLERTITGNSIHYILTPEGQVVDGLPGLYGPAAFLARIERAHTLAAEIAGQPAAQRTDTLTRYHHAAVNQIAAQWQADLEAVRLAASEASQQGAPMGPHRAAAVPVAHVASDVELQPLATLQSLFAGLEQQTTDDTWDRIAALHVPEAVVDAATRRVIDAQRPNAAAAGRLSMTKSVVEDPLLRLVRNLQRSIALDTVRNEYTLHRRLHSWLAQTPYVAQDVEALNARVYAELFLTPSSDPWLGLAQPDVYTALPDNGVVLSRPEGGRTR